MAKKASTKKVRITLVRSTISRKPNQRKTAQALGLRKIGSSIEVALNPSIQGMISTIDHLVKVEEIK